MGSMPNGVGGAIMKTLVGSMQSMTITRMRVAKGKELEAGNLYAAK